VSGTVTVDGEPVPEHSEVLFFGTEGGYTATGVVGPGGKYSLKYNGSSSVPAIKYQVQISPPVEATASKEPIDPAAMSATIKSMANNQTKNKPKVEETGPFPSRYNSRNTSKLDFSVVAGSNTANFDLTKKADATVKK